MDRITFLDNAHQGKNDWWRYLLNSITTWLGPFILILLMLIPFIILNHPTDMSINPEKVTEENPLLLIVFLGIYYTLSFLIFFGFSRFIHHKTILNMINTASRIKWMQIFKGAGLWSLILGTAVLVDVLINPSPIKLSLDLPFLTLLILSLIIFSIQASFEEIFFRGYLMQGIGLLTRKPFLPIFFTSVIFAIGHFWNGETLTTSLAAVFNMFIFGMVLGIITLGENSLETAIGAHIANNILVTTMVNGLDFMGNLPSLFTTGFEPSLGVPYFILPFILLMVVFWKKSDKLSLIFKTQNRINEIHRELPEIKCINCKTINPGISIYCMNCGKSLTREYASTARKLVAFLIDMTLMMILSGVFLVILIFITLTVPVSSIFSLELISGTWILITSMMIFFYLVLMEKSGKTMGKIAMGLKVVGEDTQKPINYRQSILRNLFLVADMIPFILPGLLGLLVSLKSDKKQRIGDMVAGTIVIKD